MSRNLIVSLLMLSMLGACSSTRIGGIGPHRIDVQQGNALDQESVAKLKLGLSRSQVRFLLGTPLLVDIFRNNRWDYVYTYHKAGKLTEQKRITLFFDNDILQRMEGDVPVVAAEIAAAPTQAPLAATPAAPVTPVALKSTAVESTPVELAPKPTPVTPSTAANVAIATPVSTPTPLVQTPPVSAAASATPAASTRSTAPLATSATTSAATSIVAPLASHAVPVAAATSRTSTDLQLHPETNVAQIQPNVIPPFPEPNTPPPAKLTQASVLSALKAWSDAWSQGNADAYIAAYAADYVPAGGDTHAAWEKRRRALLGIAKNVELRIESPKVKMMADGHALVTFKQYYRSTNNRDDLVKEIKFVQRDGRWVIVNERVVSTLQAPKL